MQQRYELLRPALNERLRRLWAAAEAVALGTGGVVIMSRATGLSRSTIRAGIKQLKEPDGEWMELTKRGRIRKPGAGRKCVADRESGIEKDLESLMDSHAIGEFGPLVWTCKSLRKLAEELGAAGHSVSYRTVGNLLHRLGYSFGRSGDYKKCSEAHRRDSFCRIAEASATFLQREEPVIFVRSQMPSEVAAISHLAISGLLNWWRQSGLQRYPRARRMLIAAQCVMSGSAWTAPLGALATEFRLEIATVHFPPGAWRWTRSVRQVTCSCSLLEGAGGGTEIRVGLDLVLPGVKSS